MKSEAFGGDSDAFTPQVSTPKRLSNALLSPLQQHLGGNKMVYMSPMNFNQVLTDTSGSGVLASPMMLSRTGFTPFYGSSFRSGPSPLGSPWNLSAKSPFHNMKSDFKSPKALEDMDLKALEGEGHYNQQDLEAPLQMESKLVCSSPILAAFTQLNSPATPSQMPSSINNITPLQIDRQSSFSSSSHHHESDVGRSMISNKRRGADGRLYRMFHLFLCCYCGAIASLLLLFFFFGTGFVVIDGCVRLSYLPVTFCAPHLACNDYFTHSHLIILISLTALNGSTKKSKILKEPSLHMTILRNVANGRLQNDNSVSSDDEEEQSPSRARGHPKRFDLDANMPPPAPRSESIMMQPPKNGNGSGSSCHQCKSRRTMEHLVFCCNMFTKKPGKGKRRICRKKYCLQCLHKFYKEQPPEPRNDPSSSWLCPSCRNKCSCALCRRVRTSQDAAPLGVDQCTSMAYGIVFFDKLKQLQDGDWSSEDKKKFEFHSLWKKFALYGNPEKRQQVNLTSLIEDDDDDDDEDSEE